MVKSFLQKRHKNSFLRFLPFKFGVVAVLVSILFFAVSPKQNAACASNIAGINIGPNFEQFGQAASLVGPGGWVYVMGQIGDCAEFEAMFRQAAQANVNVVIRGHFPDTSLTPALGRSWAATLANMDTGGQKVFFMPANEPNNPQERDAQGNRHTINGVGAYLDALIGELDAYGVRGNKVFLLSPLLDQQAPEYDQWVGPMNLNRFDGISMNLYDHWPPCSSGSLNTNACRYRELADSKGFNKPIFAVESGVVVPGEGPVYRDDQISRFIRELGPRWNNDGNFRMFAVFSYDPHRPGSWDLFSGSQTRAAYAEVRSAGSAERIGAIDEGAVRNRINSKLASGELIRCPDGCGLAESDELCLSSGISDRRRVVTPASVVTGVSDTFSLLETFRASIGTARAGDTVRADYGAGGSFIIQAFSDPADRDVLQRFGGGAVSTGLRGTIPTGLPSDYSMGARPADVLIPEPWKDQLRYDYQQKCASGEYFPAECVTTDRRNYVDFCPPPTERKNHETGEIEKVFSNRPAACENKCGTYRDWVDNCGADWRQVPLFDNPLIKVDNAVHIGSEFCELPGDTDISLIYSNVRGINNATSYLNNILHKPTEFDLSELSPEQRRILETKWGDQPVTPVEGIPTDDVTTSIDFTPPIDGRAFAGFSYGSYTHYNGMSQWGALARARGGQSYRDILRHYYRSEVVTRNDIPSIITVKLRDGTTRSYDFQRYLYGLAEMPASWPLEALKAQAIAARHYAWRSPWPICSTQACQVFNPSQAANPHPNWRRAVDETRNMVLTGNVRGQYSSTTGGFLNETGWDVAPGGSWPNQAYERLANAPWFYKAWYTLPFRDPGNRCGLTHPWLTETQMVDILNAWVVWQGTQSTGHIVPMPSSCHPGNPPAGAMTRLAGAGAINEIYGANGVVNMDTGRTSFVEFETDRGYMRVEAEIFRTIFNLRAPGYVSVKSRLFNVEMKQGGGSAGSEMRFETDEDRYYEPGLGRFVGAVPTAEIVPSQETSLTDRIKETLGFRRVNEIDPITYPVRTLQYQGAPLDPVTCSVPETPKFYRTINKDFIEVEGEAYAIGNFGHQCTVVEDPVTGEIYCDPGEENRQFTLWLEVLFPEYDKIYMNTAAKGPGHMHTIFAAPGLEPDFHKIDQPILTGVTSASVSFCDTTGDTPEGRLGGATGSGCFDQTRHGIQIYPEQIGHARALEDWVRGPLLVESMMTQSSPGAPPGSRPARPRPPQQPPSRPTPPQPSLPKAERPPVTSPEDAWLENPREGIVENDNQEAESGFYLPERFCALERGEARVDINVSAGEGAGIIFNGEIGSADSALGYIALLRMSGDRGLHIYRSDNPANMSISEMERLGGDSVSLDYNKTYRLKIFVNDSQNTHRVQLYDGGALISEVEFSDEQFSGGRVGYFTNNALAGFSNAVVTGFCRGETVLEPVAPPPPGVSVDNRVEVYVEVDESYNFGRYAGEFEPSPPHADENPQKAVIVGWRFRHTGEQARDEKLVFWHERAYVPFISLPFVDEDANVTTTKGVGLGYYEGADPAHGLLNIYGRREANSSVNIMKNSPDEAVIEWNYFVVDARVGGERLYEVVEYFYVYPSGAIIRQMKVVDSYSATHGYSYKPLTLSVLNPAGYTWPDTMQRVLPSVRGVNNWRIMSMAGVINGNNNNNNGAMDTSVLARRVPPTDPFGSVETEMDEEELETIGNASAGYVTANVKNYNIYSVYGALSNVSDVSLAADPTSPFGYSYFLNTIVAYSGDHSPVTAGNLEIIEEYPTETDLIEVRLNNIRDSVRSNQYQERPRYFLIGVIRDSEDKAGIASEIKNKGRLWLESFREN